MYFQSKHILKINFYYTHKHPLYLQSKCMHMPKTFLHSTLLYNGYDYLIEKNLLKNLFGIEIIIVNQDNFYLKIY